MLVRLLLALSPILIVLVLMIQFRWGGAKAGAAGWLTALLVSVVFFGAGPSLLAYSQMRALLLTIYVLYIVWMALILYNVVEEAGVIASVGRQISRLTGDRVLQLLLLSWVFSSFLQGVAGYGVPIAVVAPLLIGLGFDPVMAVSAVAIGHGWSVTFGSMAASFNALIGVSGLPGETLAPSSAMLLGLCCYACGICALLACGGLKALRHGLPAILVVGTVMAGTQYLLATSGLWNISAFAAGLAGLLAMIPVARLPFYRTAPDICPHENRVAPATAADDRPPMPALMAASPYILLLILVIVAELVGPVHRLLNSVNIQMSFPETKTSLGWVTAAGKGQSTSVFGHAGALLGYVSLVAYIMFKAMGHYRSGAGPRILSKTVKSAGESSLGIVPMVGFAMIMDQSGMTNVIAAGLSQSVAPMYSLISPFIGVLGSFMTGSNTNSNVVFAGLQKQSSQLLGLPLALILGAQTTGGSIGGMLAPARIIVGASTAGLVGQEGKVLKKTVGYGLVITLLIGIVTWVASWLGVGFVH